VDLSETKDIAILFLKTPGSASHNTHFMANLEYAGTLEWRSWQGALDNKNCPGLVGNDRVDFRLSYLFTEAPEPLERIAHVV
jgi:hypothetical protein